MKTLADIKGLNTAEREQEQLKDLLIKGIQNDTIKSIRESKTMIYYVTTNGDVYSVAKGNKRIRKLKPYVTAKGYLQIKTVDNKNERVHRLVAEAFDPDFQPHLQINHIRKDEKQNNNIDNLEVCTLIENMAHRYISDKLPNWNIEIKDIRVAEPLATDEKNLLQVLDFHYMMSHFISDIPMFEVVDTTTESEIN